MKKLHLHIGMHKTGTSSLQATLFGSRNTLSENDIAYLDIEDNHSAALFSLFTPAPEKYRVNIRRGINTAEKAAEHNRALAELLQQKLAATTCAHTIISGEDLSLLPKNRVPMLKGFLEPYFDHIQIIGYARPPVSFVNSLAQQALKGGATYDALTRTPPKPDYQWRFQKFLDTFGDEHVTLRPFIPDALKSNCIVADFLDAAGLPTALHRLLTVRRNNSSLSGVAALLLDHINHIAPAFQDGKPNPARPPDVPATVAQLKGAGFNLPREVVERALMDADWDISWMARRLANSDAPSLLFDDRDRMPSLPEKTQAPLDMHDPRIRDILNTLFPDGVPGKPA